MYIKTFNLNLLQMPNYLIFLQAVKINDDDHTFTLDEELLNEILDDEKVRDKPVCVVSVAGSMKSLFLVLNGIYSEK